MGPYQFFADPQTIARTEFGKPAVYKKYVLAEVTQTIAGSCGKDINMYIAENHLVLGSGSSGPVFHLQVTNINGGTQHQYILRGKSGSTYSVKAQSSAQSGCVPKSVKIWQAWQQLDNPKLNGAYAIGTGFQIGVNTLVTYGAGTGTQGFQELFPGDSYLNTIEVYFSTNSNDYPLANANSSNIVYKICEAPTGIDCGKPPPPKNNCEIPEKFLVGWYEGKDFKDASGKQEWNDKSGKGNNLNSPQFSGTGFSSSSHLPEMQCLGGVELCKARNHVSVSGTKDASFTFPTGILTDLYTIVSMVRYNKDPGQPTADIFALTGSGVALNFSSGFGRAGQEGYAKHGSTLITDANGNRANGLYAYDPNFDPQNPNKRNGEWLVSADQRSMYRGNGMYWTKYTPTVLEYFRTLAVNPNKNTGWNIMEVLLFDVELTIEQIKCLEYNYLGAKYSMIPLPPQCLLEYDTFPQQIYQVVGGNGAFWNFTKILVKKDTCDDSANNKIFGRKTLVRVLGKCKGNTADNALYFGFMSNDVYNAFALPCGTNDLNIAGTTATGFAYPDCTYNSQKDNFLQYRSSSTNLNQRMISNPKNDIPLNNSGQTLSHPSHATTDDASAFGKMHANGVQLPSGGFNQLRFLIEEFYDKNIAQSQFDSEGRSNLRPGYTKFTIFKGNRTVTCQYNGTVKTNQNVELLVGVSNSGAGANAHFELTGFRTETQCAQNFNITSGGSTAAHIAWLEQEKHEEGGVEVVRKMSVSQKMMLFERKFWIVMWCMTVVVNVTLLSLIFVLWRNGAVQNMMVYWFKSKVVYDSDVSSASDSETSADESGLMAAKKNSRKGRAFGVVEAAGLERDE